MEWLEFSFTILTAVISSSAVAAIVASRATYRGIAVEAITKERITWLDELRKIAEDFSVASGRFALSNPSDDIDKGQLDRLSARLELQLNPHGEQEVRVIQAASKMVRKAKARADDFSEAEREFVLETRKLLKAEWQKAKSEAGVK